MKYRKIWLIIVTYFLFLFQISGENQHRTNNIVSKGTTGLNKCPKKIIVINGRTIDWRNFQKVYCYISQEGDEKQILGVNYFSKDSIGYQLFHSSDECNLEIHGFAKNIRSKGTMFDKDGIEKYSIDEYISMLEHVSIKIESKFKTKAKFIYKPIKKDEECDPNNEIIMRTNNDPLIIQ